MADCSKVPYANLYDAAKALQSITHHRAARGLTGPVAVHFCVPCGAWQLTSHRPGGRLARRWQRVAESLLRDVPR